MTQKAFSRVQGPLVSFQATELLDTGFVMSPGLKQLAHPPACSRMMNGHVFAGWLELFFNSSLAVPCLSVLAKEGRERTLSLAAAGQPAPALLYPWRQSSVSVHLSVSGSDSPDAPPPQATQQLPAEVLAVLGALGLGSLRGPGWQDVCSAQGGELACASECPSPGTSPFPIPDYLPPLSCSHPSLQGQGATAGGSSKPTLQYLLSVPTYSG